MAWTYSLYNGVNVGISTGLVAIIFIGVFVIFGSSKKGQEFILDKVIGVDPTKAEDEDDDKNGDKIDSKDADKKDGKDAVKKDGTDSINNDVKKNSIIVISVFFCLLGALTLSITAVLIFQGCFLANTIVLPNGNCPDYPMDCFILNKTAYAPITDNVSFYCDPLNKTQFPSSMPDATALCFGWIIQQQTTKHILDQLGVCTGLIGRFTTMLAIVVYLGRCKKTLILCTIFILCCGVTFILLLFFKWSLSVLAYAVLILGISLGIFGLCLFCIIPKRKKVKDNEQISAEDTNRAKMLSSPAISLRKSPRPTTTSPVRIKVLQQTSKVTPK